MCTGDLIASADCSQGNRDRSSEGVDSSNALVSQSPPQPRAEVESPKGVDSSDARVNCASAQPQSFPNKRDTHPLQFCIEVFAKRAELTAAVRQVLPNSFGVGTGCDAHTRAPVIPIDVLSCSDQALCLSWVREPGCLWVHVRCPRAMFPIGHASHHVECAPGPQAFALIRFLKSLVKHCRDTDTSWSVEAPSRSLLWEHCNHVAIGERVQINLCSFGHPYRSPVTIATSRPSAFSALALPCEHDHKCSRARVNMDACLSAFNKALAAAILRSLDVGAPDEPALHGAQILAGSQPRKSKIAPVSEFKHVALVVVASMPKVDTKGRLVQSLIMGNTCIPQGSKVCAVCDASDRKGKAKLSASPSACTSPGSHDPLASAAMPTEPTPPCPIDLRHSREVTLAASSEAGPQAPTTHLEHTLVASPVIGYAPKSLHPKSALAASSGAGSPSLNSFAEVGTLAVVEGHNGDCVDLRQSCATPVKRTKTNHLHHYGPSSWETPPKVERHEHWRSCASPPEASMDALRAKPAVNPVGGEAFASRPVVIPVDDGAAQHYSLALPAVNHMDDAAHSPRPVVIPVDGRVAQHFPLAQPAVNPVDGATQSSRPVVNPVDDEAAPGQGHAG